MSNRQKIANPTGAGKKPALRVAFDSRLKLEFHGSKVTSDAGLLAYRELDAALGLTDLGENLLNDWRTGKNMQHSMVALMRQSLFSRLAGYEDTNDAERLSVDPTMRQVVGGRATEHTAASTSQMGRFETEVLTQPGNLKALTKLSRKWIDRLRERQPMRELILDMDSSVSETYGEQEGTAYNGHFGCTCYHPLFCFNQFGDVEQSLLRDGNVHSAKNWRAVLEPVVARYQGRNIPRYFRADAAFANPELYEYLEAEGFEYAIRLPANDALLRDIEPMLTRPVGRPSNAPVVWYAGFLYRAKSWDRARRVVAKVEWHNGELFPRIGFIVSNLKRPAKRVVRFYNQRGAWNNLPTSFNLDELSQSKPNPTMASAAAYSLEQVDSFLGKLGNPIGIASYKPFQSEGEDFLHEYFGMMGIPIELSPEFPLKANLILLAESAEADPDIVAKIKNQLQAGKSVIITSGLLRALQNRGIKEVINAQCTNQKILARQFFGGSGADLFSIRSGGTNAGILFPQIGLLTNNVWAPVRAAAGNASTAIPLLLTDHYSNGVLYVWTIPDNFNDLYSLPQEITSTIKNYVMREFPVRLDGPAQVALFAYDNNTFIVESYLPAETDVKISVTGNFPHLKNLVTGEIIDGQLPTTNQSSQDETENRISFKIHLLPHSYKVFEMEK